MFIPPLSHSLGERKGGALATFVSSLVRSCRLLWGVTLRLSNACCVTRGALVSLGLVTCHMTTFCSSRGHSTRHYSPPVVMLVQANLLCFGSDKSPARTGVSSTEQLTMTGSDCVTGLCIDLLTTPSWSNPRTACSPGRL